MAKKNTKWKLLLATKRFAARFTTSCLGVGTMPQKTHGFQSLPSRTLPQSSRDIRTASRSLESLAPLNSYHHQSKQSYDSLLRKPERNVMAIPLSPLTRTDSISSISLCTSTHSSHSFDHVERERNHWENLILNKDYTLPLDNYFTERTDIASPHLLRAFHATDTLRNIANCILVTS